LVKIVVFERGWVTLSTKFRANEVSPTNDCWHQKTRVPAPWAIVWHCLCILGLATLVDNRLVTDRQKMDIQWQQVSH